MLFGVDFNKILKSITIIVLLLITTTLSSQSYFLNGSAVSLGGNCYQLTDAVNNQNGTIWYSDLIDISEPFEINFMAYFGNQDGADGIVFVLQTAGNTALGNTGQNMGFGGFAPSLGVEFDTYYNNNITSPDEISDDHISIDINGDVQNVIAGAVEAIPGTFWIPPGDIENNTDYPIKITWDPTTHTMEVWFDCQLRLTLSNYDMQNIIFGGNNMVYWGFTASTGGLNNLQRICIDDNIFTVQDTVDLCIGDSVQLDVTGSPTHTYTWSPATNIDNVNSQTPTVWPSVNTTYTVTYDDYCGNQQTDDVVVLVHQPPTPNLGNDTSICQGASITLDAGVWNNYLWSSASTTQTETFTGAGTYSITVTDNYGCQGNDDIIVLESTPPVVSAGADVTICTGGTATLTATGTGTFLWNTTETTQSINVSPTITTTYSVILTDANGCTNSDNVDVIIGTGLTASAGSNVTICEGETTILTGSGGTNYLWSTSETTSSISVSPSTTTTYYVTVDDGTGCTGTASVDVTVNPSPSVDAGPNQSVCAGETINLTASGANTYLWSTNETTNGISITPVNSAYYYVTGTNTNSCSDTDSVYITVNPLPIVDAGNDATICTGGSATLTATGTGTGTFLWSTNETTQSINVSPTITTTYSVILTDVNGCTNSDNVDVIIGTGLTASAGSNVTICEGETTILTGSGGTNYLWSTSETTSSISVSPSTTTTYYVTVDDGTGCTGTASVDVTVNPSPSVDAGPNQSVCAGETINLTASGANTYLWSTSETTNSISITPVNSAYYYVTGTNTNSCSDTDSVYITVNPLPIVDAGNDATICTGGSATLTATGTGTFLWSTNETTQSITVSPTSNTNYTVILTDVNNCTATDNVNVNVGSSIIASAGNDTTVCMGNSVTLTASGGTNYLWSTSETTQSITVMPGVHTSYSVTVSDGTSCTGTDIVVVDVNPLPIIDAGANQSICLGSNTIISATGGVSYTWSTGDNTQNVSLSPSANQYYYVTGTDVNLCSNNDSVLVSINPLPVVNLGNDVSVCQGASIDLSVSTVGTYLWSTGETTQDITVSPTINQTISVTVTDANNCSNSDDINIDVSGSINITTSADTSACVGNSITLSAFGGTNYSWSNGSNSSTTNVNVGISNTYYYVTVSDGGSCSGVDSILVSALPNPNVDAGANIQICGGETVLLTATGASQYIWDNGTTQANNNVNPTLTTTYFVTGTDNNGCSASDDVTVSVVGDISLTITHSPEIVCPGEQVILTTNIVGGTPPYTIVMDDGTIVSPPLIIIPEETTIFNLSVTSSSCNQTVTGSDTIKVYDVPTPVFTSDITEGCVPLAVSFNNSNTEANLTYFWDFGNSINNLSTYKNPIQVYYESGTFDVSLTLTTEEGCKSSTTVNNMITAYPLPNAKFYAEPTVVSVINSTVDFYNVSTGNYFNYWSFGDGDSSLFINPSHKYNPNILGDFVVTLVAVTENGCKDTAISTIKVEDIATMYVPTAFTPDGDGINDVFKVSCSGIDTDNFILKIYDRWGEIIFESNDLFVGWNGIVKNGKMAESGVYSYLIYYNDFTGVQYTKSGIFTLIR